MEAPPQVFTITETAKTGPPHAKWLALKIIRGIRPERSQELQFQEYFAVECGRITLRSAHQQS
jgi:hypothetical protein